MGSSQSQPVKIDSKFSGYDFSKGVNSFGDELFQKMSQKGENVFVSPFSIVSALTMLTSGATANSSTFIELRKSLRQDQFPEGDVEKTFRLIQGHLNAEKDVQVVVANSVWASGLLQTYISHLQNNLGAEAYPLTTAGPINDWVCQKTNKMIPKIVDSLPDDCPGVLVNCIYFKGDWADPFEKEATNDQHFTDSSGKQFQVKMMHKTFESIGYVQKEKFASVLLPYGKNKEYQCVIVLPNKGVQADSLSLSDMYSLPFSSSEVAVSLPRLDVTTPPTSLDSFLKQMGMKSMYSGGFSRLSDSPECRVQTVLHAAKIKLDEKGTEAAAVTAVVMEDECETIPQPPIPFVVDRTFFILIQDASTCSNLFIGKIEKPQ